MKAVLLGGPKDGLVVEMRGDRVFALVEPQPRFLEESDLLESSPLRVAVYGPGRLWHPDRSPDLCALKFAGYLP